MKITIVTQENILEYWSYLSSDEIFGINDRRLSCFFISDEDGKPAGKMAVQLLPEYIRLENLFIFPEFRHRGFGTGFLDFLKKRPKEASLPIRAFLEDEEDVRLFLERSGFTEEKCDYNIITGSFGDFINPYTLIKKKSSDEGFSKLKLSRLDHVAKTKLRNFILDSPHDEIFLFPDKALDLDRFSDGSIICQKGDQIEAALLLEETDEYTQFSWMYGNDRFAVLLCLVAAWKDLEAEYGPGYQIRCLCRDEATLKTYEKLFSDHELKKIKMYSFA